MRKPPSWIWLFLILQILFTPFFELNHNTSSRFATMGAFCSTGTFEITPYLSQTDDWSLAPDGRYFSNKAPGGIILGLPFYCAALEIRKTLQPSARNTAERVRDEWQIRYVLNLFMSLLLQILPWIWICKRWFVKLEEKGVSEEAREFAILALLFGTTPAILMDIYIGHPIVAFFSMLSLLAIMEEQALLLGFALGMLQLTEYSSFLLFPAAILAFPNLHRRWPRVLSEICLGALLPAILWVVYHERAFGGPFEIANRYINPQFRDRAHERFQLWGILAPPDPLVLLRLIFGWRRGVLFSQPWILVAAGALPFVTKTPDSRRALIYCEAGLALLLVMNASFGGWHGGATAGPRYLSAALPAFAIPVALTWDSLTEPMKRLLWATLGFSFIVFAIAKVRSPTSGLWLEWVDQIREMPFEFAWKLLLELLIIAAFAWPRRVTPRVCARSV